MACYHACYQEGNGQGWLQLRRCIWTQTSASPTIFREVRNKYIRSFIIKITNIQWNPFWQSECPSAHMRTITRAVSWIALLLCCGISAMADITWTLNDVAFNDGNVATGYFVTNDSASQYESFSVAVTGPLSSRDFVATIAVDSYLPTELGFSIPGFTEYLDLILDTPLTSAGGEVEIGSGYDCPGCGTLLVADDPSVNGVVPEPTAVLLFGTVVGLFGFTLRRKLVHPN